jgi:hypothetical protein
MMKAVAPLMTKMKLAVVVLKQFGHAIPSFCSELLVAWVPRRVAVAVDAAWVTVALTMLVEWKVVFVVAMVVAVPRMKLAAC